MRYHVRPTEARFWEKVRRLRGCWLWRSTLSHRGYGLFWYHTGQRSAHRMAWELTYGSVPSGLLVLHHCDTRACVRPEHLYLGTHADNMRDRAARGRTAHGARSRPIHQIRGEAQWKAKLTAELVRAIRVAYIPRRISYRKLAARFGVHEATIKRVVTRQSWAHVL